MYGPSSHGSDCVYGRAMCFLGTNRASPRGPRGELCDWVCARLVWSLWCDNFSSSLCFLFASISGPCTHSRSPPKCRRLERRYLPRGWGPCASFIPGITIVAEPYSCLLLLASRSTVQAVRLARPLPSPCCAWEAWSHTAFYFADPSAPREFVLHGQKQKKDYCRKREPSFSSGVVSRLAPACGLTGAITSTRWIWGGRGVLSRFEAYVVCISSWNRTDNYRHGVDIFLLLDAVVVSMARGPLETPARASVRSTDHGPWGGGGAGPRLGAILGGPDWARVTHRMKFGFGEGWGR